MAGKSLQDQLLKAGLANKKQAVRAKKAKNHKEKLARVGVSVDDEIADATQKARQEKLDKDRELNEQKNPVSYTHLTLPTICSV